MSQQVFFHPCAVQKGSYECRWLLWSKRRPDRSQKLHKVRHIIWSNVQHWPGTGQEKKSGFGCQSSIPWLITGCACNDVTNSTFVKKCARFWCAPPGMYPVQNQFDSSATSIMRQALALSEVQNHRFFSIACLPALRCFVTSKCASGI